jgi:hypothetical protein
MSGDWAFMSAGKRSGMDKHEEILYCRRIIRQLEQAIKTICNEIVKRHARIAELKAQPDD